MCNKLHRQPYLVKNYAMFGMKKDAFNIAIAKKFTPIAGWKVRKYRKEKNMFAEKLAIIFHETYERLAPRFGYETRPETRKFDKNSPNGRLMIAVCEEVLQHLFKNAVFCSPDQFAEELINDSQQQIEEVKCPFCNKSFYIEEGQKTVICIHCHKIIERK